MPPDNSAGVSTPASARPAAESAQTTRSFTALGRMPRRPSTRRPYVTLSATVIESKSVAPWNTIPTLQRTVTSSFGVARPT